MDLAEKLKLCRKEKKLTQKELAKLSGISEISIRKYENGSRKPKYETLKKFSEILNVPMSWMMDESDSKSNYTDVRQRNNLKYYSKLDEDSKEVFNILNINIEKLKTSTDKNKFLEDLSKINPLEIKLKNYIENFSSFKKEDLISFYNEWSNYLSDTLKTFIDDEYTPLYERYSQLVLKAESQSNNYTQLIEKLFSQIEHQSQVINNQEKIIETLKGIYKNK